MRFQTSFVVSAVQVQAGKVSAFARTVPVVCDAGELLGVIAHAQILRLYLKFVHNDFDVVRDIELRCC